MSNQAKIKILFVCLGNICRSPAAQGVMQRLVDERGLGHRFDIDSAGTMRVHARRRGLELTHSSRRITPDDMERFDVIVAMDSANESDLRDLAATVEQTRKIVRMGDFIRFNRHYDHVPDPYYEGSEGFELVLDLLEDSCDHLLDHLLQHS